MKKNFVVPIIFLFFLSACVNNKNIFWCDRTILPKDMAIPQKIAFGSCASQNKDQPILYTAVDKKPQLFIYLGDNIYGDSKNLLVLKEKYGILSCKPEFKNLCKNIPVMAVWDDHDYGANDAGEEYPEKVASKELFLDFWKEPLSSARRTHTGVYHSEMVGDSAHLVQIILLDNRTFRSSLITQNGSYQPNQNPAATMLGEEQWAWLKNELQKPAKIRIIGSSTQFATAHNGWEAWANFPLEQKKMTDLIHETHAEGVVFISGDVHYAELSKINPANGYPIYDMTSSGITQVEYSPAKNPNRVGAVQLGQNIGMLEIDWQADPVITFLGLNENGDEKIKYSLKLSELKF